MDEVERSSSNYCGTSALIPDACIEGLFSEILSRWTPKIIHSIYNHTRSLTEKNPESLNLHLVGLTPEYKKSSTSLRSWFSECGHCVGITPQLATNPAVNYRFKLGDNKQNTF